MADKNSALNCAFRDSIYGAFIDVGVEGRSVDGMLVGRIRGGFVGGGRVCETAGGRGTVGLY